MSRKLIDLTGDRYGRLVVVEESERKGYSRRWKCRCDCGNETIVHMSSLRSGNTTSCGCFQRERTSQTNFSDLSGKQFGRLTALEATFRKGRRVYWSCKCECGNDREVSADRLLQGVTKSCGCLRTDEGNALQKYNKDNLTKDGVFTPILRRKVRSDNQSGVKGVHKRTRKNGSVYYEAYIKIKGKSHYLGSRPTAEEAAKLRKVGEEKYHKPYLQGLDNGY